MTILSTEYRCPCGYRTRGVDLFQTHTRSCKKLGKVRWDVAKEKAAAFDEAPVEGDGIGSLVLPVHHYRGRNGLQPWDVIEAFQLDYFEGAICKYLLRWRKKNGVEDLKKARLYIEYLIKREESE